MRELCAPEGAGGEMAAPAYWEGTQPAAVGYGISPKVSMLKRGVVAVPSRVHD